MEGSRQGGKDATALLRSDRHQGRDDALELGLEQIDEREFLLDAVHDIDDELSAGIRHPGLDRTSLLDVAAIAADGLVIGDIPGIDLVAVHAQYAGISDPAEKAGAVERQCQARACTLVTAGQQLGEVIAHPRQRQLEVVIAERDREVAALGPHKPGERRPAGREGRVADDPVELAHGAGRIERDGVRFGEKVDQIAIDDQRHAGGRQCPDMLDESRERVAGIEDLEAGPATHMQIGDRIELVELRELFRCQVNTGRHPTPRPRLPVPPRQPEVDRPQVCVP